MAGLGIIHLGAVLGLVYAILRPSVPTLILAVVLYLLGGMSITAGYHRLFAHRTYRASAPVRWFFLAFGASTFQNSALSWSADHRAHHADTDGPGDPHAITKGVWWAHMGWLFYRRECSADVSRLTDLYAVRSVRLQNRYYAVLAIGLGLVLPTAIAATWGDPWGGLLVAGVLRGAVLLQATFCVNSLAHLVGRRRYDESVTRAGQRPDGARHLRRGLSQLPPPFPVRLSQRHPLVAVRPEQVADLVAGATRAGEQGTNGVAADRGTGNGRGPHYLTP